MVINNEQFRHTIPIQIRFNDIDYMGHVSNSAYHQYLDVARIDYFENVLKDKIQWKTKTLILVHFGIDFLSPVFLSDKIKICSKVTKVGNKSISMLQHVIAGDKNELRSPSTCVLVFFDKEGKKAIQVPDNWRQKIEAYENACP